jgi:hypothetical protein
MLRMCDCAYLKECGVFVCVCVYVCVLPEHPVSKCDIVCDASGVPRCNYVFNYMCVSADGCG